MIITRNAVDAMKGDSSSEPLPGRRCREYITGFRKRKQARRKEALGKLEKRQRQQRLDERAEVSAFSRRHPLCLTKYPPAPHQPTAL